jgi:hypothetical protein
VEEGMTARFEEWLEAVFDHPVGEPEWYWASDFEVRWESLQLSSATGVAYLTRLHSDPAVLGTYSLEQVAQGIWFLVGESSPAQPSHALLDRSISLEPRLACVKAMAAFFGQFVAGAAPHAADTAGNPFHVACYMWWDVFPTWGGSAEPELDQACLAVMADCLTYPSELYQLSGLHGLSHWYLTHGEQVERIVDAFLAASPELRPRIREYAALARHGLAQ